MRNVKVYRVTDYDTVQLCAQFPWTESQGLRAAEQWFSRNHDFLFFIEWE